MPSAALHHRVLGDGSPVLVLHGFMGTSDAMGGVVSLLASAHTVIAVDLMGHGRSSAPPDLEPYGAAAQVAQLQQVLSERGIADVSVVGYSMGARLALTLAVAAPSLVRRLALIGGTPGIADPDEASERVSTDALLARMLERDGVESFVDYWETLPLFASQTRLPPPVRAQIRAGRLQQRAEGLASSLRGFGAGSMPSLWDRLDELVVPTLAIAGELDAKYAAIAHEMAAIMPRGHAAFVPDAGHAAHTEAPDATAALLLDWFAP